MGFALAYHRPMVNYTGIPLVLSRELIVGILMGSVTDWADERIVALNEQVRDSLHVL